MTRGHDCSCGCGNPHSELHRPDGVRRDDRLGWIDDHWRQIAAGNQWGLMKISRAGQLSLPIPRGDTAKHGGNEETTLKLAVFVELAIGPNVEPFPFTAEIGARFSEQITDVEKVDGRVIRIDD